MELYKQEDGSFCIPWVSVGGKCQSFIKCGISSHLQTEKWLTPGGAELIRHSPSPRPCHRCSPRVTPNPVPNPALLRPTGRAGGRAPADNVSPGGYLEKPANPSNTRCFLQKHFYIHIKTSRRDFLILMNFSMK